MLQMNQIYNMDCKPKREMSEEHKKNLSDSLKKAHAEKRHKGAFKQGHEILGFQGKQHTEEWKKQQSSILKENNPMHDENVVIKRSATIIENGIFAGSNNSNWRGGRPKYRGADWRKQRAKALERDKYICQKCGVNQENIKRELTVHHILPYHDGGTNELTNLITVCMSCHFSMEPRRKKVRDDA